MNKKDKQALKAKMEGYLTVAQLIEQLKTFPQSAVIGVQGHYGEFHAYDKHTFWYCEGAKTYIKLGSWGNETTHEFGNIVQVSQESIGDEPD